MTRPTISGARGLGLRTQILLMLLGGAILPLALVGMWLTSSSKRSGERLLASHLNESADKFLAAVNSRWEYRQSDEIHFIAGNEATRRAVSADSITHVDRIYLDSEFPKLARLIPVIELRDSADSVRWRTTPASRAAFERARGGSAAPMNAGPTMRLETPVLAESGKRIGTVVTQVAIAALVPADSARPLIPGARLALRNSSSGAILIPLDRVAQFPEGERVQVADSVWMVAYRSIARPALEIAIAAPLAPYVDGFVHAAAIGVAAIGAVSLLAILLTVLLATRATRPLRELVAASDAVTRGQLHPQVSIGGPSEVRRVGAAFNVMTENLRETIAALSKRSALAAVGEFATSLSHDVRNALTAVKVDLERAANRKIADPVTDLLVNRAINNVARLENSVTAALRVARHGQAPAEELDLRIAIEDAVDTVRGTFAALPAALETDLPTVPVLVKGDAAALQQLVANLLFNSAQALAPGGDARVVVRRANGVAEIEVSDSGKGIPPAEMLRMQTPFYSSKPNGTGLGLAIARQIVAGHGGELTIESEIGRGTNVRVRLPCVNGSSASITQVVSHSAEVDAGDFQRK